MKKSEVLMAGNGRKQGAETDMRKGRRSMVYGIRRFRMLLKVPLWALCTVGTGILLVSCMALQETWVIPPDVPGATFIGNKKCRACHFRHMQNFPRSTHARLEVPGAKDAEGMTGCEACHGPGSLHQKAKLPRSWRPPSLTRAPPPRRVTAVTLRRRPSSACPSTIRCRRGA